MFELVFGALGISIFFLLCGLADWLVDRMSVGDYTE